jgi:SAM-dependent methyltransferase
MASPSSSIRHEHEVEHGKYLSEGLAEEIWGWGSPAGRLRAKRRAAVILQVTESGGEIIAVDLSPHLLSVARQRDLSRVRFLERSFEDCEVDGPFDAVIGSSVLHHLDLDRTWPKVFSLLKPGGRLSFAEPNMLNPQVYCERHFRQFFPQVSPDETAFVRTRLRRDLQRAGFVSVSIKPFDWLHPATPRALIPLVSGIGRAFEGIWPVREFAGSLRIWARRPE